MIKVDEKTIDKAIKELDNIEISIHCWQTDDVAGFELDRTLSGGIQVTGNYLGKARDKEEVFADLEFVLSQLSGKFRLNLHACYLISTENHDRNQINYDDFKDWVEFAKKNNVKLDFNPTFFSHDKADNGFTLSSQDEQIRAFWVEHGKRSLKIAEQIARELDDHCLYNIWIPDGCKERPVDRLIHRETLLKSLDEILAIDYDKALVPVSVESKVFGMGLESYTVGSHEFYMNYAATRNINCLIDTGHFHPTENVADKLSSLALFNDKIALHLTRDVRWDSDHVLIRNENLTEVCDEIVRLGHQKFFIGLDFFDGSINRQFAYISGIRNLQKTLLRSLINNYSLETPVATKSYDILQYEFLKDNFDFVAAWNQYLKTNNLSEDQQTLTNIKEYENSVLKERK